MRTAPTTAGKNRKKLILAITLLAILIVGVGYAFIRIYTSTSLTITTTPNPSQSGMTVDVRGRLTDGFGIGLVGYNVTVESSPDGVHWSELAGPFLTQPSSGSGQQKGTWYVQGGWGFSSTIFLRAVFAGYGSYSQSISSALREIVNALSLSQYWGTFYYPWYGNGTLPASLSFNRNATSEDLGHTEPDVIKYNGLFLLYYRTDGSIGVAASKNGLVWSNETTLLGPTEGSWDNAEAIAPSVIWDSGTFYLYYEGANSNGTRYVGLATAKSPLGPFSKLPDPVLSPSLGWETTITGTPAIVKIGGQFYLFYHGFNGVNDQIGVAYSASPTGPFQKEVNNPILPVGPLGSWDDYKTGRSSIYTDGFRVWVFYEGNDGTNWRTGYATGTSSGGRITSLTRAPENPVVDLGNQSSLDSTDAQLPSVLEDKGQLLLYYSGNNGLAFHLMRASMSTPDVWRHWNGCPCNSTSSSLYNPPNTWESHFLPNDDSGSFNPTSELYSSLSATLINRDLAWMDDARFNFTLVSWWGQNSFEDNAFRLMLTEAQHNATLHLKPATYYELEGKGDPTVDQIVSDLTYIYENRANFTSYFRIGPNHIPVVFVYANQYDSSAYADRWSTARSIMITKGEPMFIVLKVFGGYAQNATSVDGWYQYRSDVNATSDRNCSMPDCFSHYELQPGYSALASPGFWSYGEASPRLNRNATGFALAVRTMASLPSSEAQFLLIETFNEWHEGTQVEPGIPVNIGLSSFTRAGPSYGLTYLDIIKNRGQTI